MAAEGTCNQFSINFSPIPSQQQHISTQHSIIFITSSTNISKKNTLLLLYDLDKGFGDVRKEPTIKKEGKGGFLGILDFLCVDGLGRRERILSRDGRSDLVEWSFRFIDNQMWSGSNERKREKEEKEKLKRWIWDDYLDGLSLDDGI